MIERIVLFGASGDLTSRLLLPALAQLAEDDLVPAGLTVVGSDITAWSTDDFRAHIGEKLREHSPVTAATRDRVTGMLSFEAADVTDAEDVGQVIGDDHPDTLVYLALPPSLLTKALFALSAAKLHAGDAVAIEKPFGTDLASCRELNQCLLSVFDESRIFRIDHYLGREAVQNLLAIRFANGMFEPVWNRDHIDHVQIDVPETLSIGTRGDFYERTGAFRDMVVTHLFQVLGFVAMEPPTSLDARHLMLERAKVFDAMPPLEPDMVIRGQYSGYRDEDGVAAESDAETYVALRASIANWRWEGVPFFLRHGKRLAESRHLLTIAFRRPPRRMFPLDCRYVAESFGFDHLTFELGDPGSISASFLAKVPGPKLRLGEAGMSFSYSTAFGGPEQALEPYERLIHDVMLGDRTLFTTSEPIEWLWQISAPLLRKPPAALAYAPGSWGPEEANELIAPRRWHLPGHSD
jgi:glucose-6-phosphate 1-dehydrogenase